MSASISDIGGIHHLTAITTNAQRTVDFFSGLLGLSLIWQAVDPDQPTAYRIAFADALFGPGTLAFAERPGAARGAYGIGGTHHLAFETRDRETLLQWKRWLTDHGVPVTGPYDRVYFQSIYFTDPDGLILEIATQGPGWTVDEAPDLLGTSVQLPPIETMVHHRDEAAIAAATWPEPIAGLTPEMRLKRMHHITAIGSDAEKTEQFFIDKLGMRLVKRTVNFDNPDSPHLYFGVGAGEPGTIITYFAYPHGTMRPVRHGAGITEHFSLSVPDLEALAAWEAKLLARGVETAPIDSETWYRGFTIHDPDGHVIEIATDVPGSQPGQFRAERGRRLHIPPALERRRADVEQTTKPLRVPDPAWSK